MTLQRTVQIACLTLFLGLLISAALRFVGWLPHDLFLRLDPAAALLTGISARIWPGGFAAALAVLGATVLLGRFFCGYLCPLGTFIDGVDASIGKPGAAQSPIPAHWPLWKYGVLILVVTAALMGLSLAFFFAPIPLVTRFFALVALPLLQPALDLLLQLAAPLADRFDLTGLLYLQLPLPRFDHQWLMLLLMALILVAGRWRPRFWCRCLCPAGALMALCARRPLFRRRVTEACVECGLCARRCPTGAIGTDPRSTLHAECIVCQSCRRVCPTQAVIFSTGAAGPAVEAAENTGFARYRRMLMLSGACGLGTAALTLSGARHLMGDSGTRRIMPPNLIRPPGARPENSFLRRCYRCGACLQACPTNTLQPFGLATGLPGWLTPVITPQRGPCDPSCTICGQICPTQAIRALGPEERIWAKVGTAQVLRHKCLAWEFDRKCLVCDEVCPYDAIELQRMPGIKAAVPFVNEKRCSGCGFCEHHCPVNAVPAIVVEPMEALRPESGSLRTQARAIGLDLQIRRSRPQPAASDQSPHDAPSDGLPPGFSE